MLEGTEGFDCKAGHDSGICNFHCIVSNKVMLKYHGKQELWICFVSAV